MGLERESPKGDSERPRGPRYLRYRVGCGIFSDKVANQTRRLLGPMTRSRMKGVLIQPFFCGACDSYEIIVSCVMS